MAPEPRGPREGSALPAAHLRELAIDVQMRVARAKEERRQRAPKSSAVRLRSKPRSARPSDAAPAEVGTHQGATP